MQKINDKYSIKSNTEINNDNLTYHLQVILNKDNSIQQDLKFNIPAHEFSKLTEELQDFLMKFYGLNIGELKLENELPKQEVIKNDIKINQTQTLSVRMIEKANGIDYKLKVYTTENPDWVTERIDFHVNNMNFPEFSSKITQAMHTTDSYQVLQFTEQSKNIKCPTTPSAMNIDELRFLYQMVLSELVEGAQTLCVDTDSALDFVRKCIGTDTNRAYKKPTDNFEIIAQQADAFVDAWYYMLNAACKKGWDLAPVFSEVHLANMNKRWSDGKFHIREDGKIEKPPNHQPANVAAIFHKILLNKK